MNKLVSSFSKGRQEEIRVQIKELKGQDIVDIRVYASMTDGEEKVATGKGFSMNPSQFSDFKKAVLETETILKEHRLIHE